MEPQIDCRDARQSAVLTDLIEQQARHFPGKLF
jgi:hypothetical protein